MRGGRVRIISARVALVIAAIALLTGATVWTGMHLGTAAAAAPAAVAVEPVAPTVSPEVLAELAALKTPPEPLDDELLLREKLAGPLGSTAIIKSPPPRAVAPPVPTSGVARIAIPRLGVDAYIERIGIVGGVMESPTDGVYAIGWYPELGTPGNGGNIVFSAHETWDHMYAPFYVMHLAQPGDKVELTMADGTKYTYEMMTNHRHPLESLAMNAVLYPPRRPENEEWITFITCGGRIVYDASGFGDYLDRDIAVARRVR